MRDIAYMMFSLIGWDQKKLNPGVLLNAFSVVMF